MLRYNKQLLKMLALYPDSPYTKQLLQGEPQNETGT